MAVTVAILGRPNVGKSTLFNRLVGKRLAIVEPRPGVTRDWKEGEGRLGDLRFRLLDTPGLEDAKPGTIEAAMRDQADRARNQADVVLLVFDGREGVTPLDAHFARWLRGFGKPVILIANKCEGARGTAGALEGFSLGLGDPVMISAEHGDGMGALYDALEPLVPVPAGGGAPEEEVAFDEETREEREPGPLRLAIVGRPNVGKSTLVNALIGEQRVLTGPEPGMTRDAIPIDWDYRGRAIRLVDTAGLRRRAHVTERIEKMSVEATERAIRLAEVVVLVVDATVMLERQDLAIARSVVEEGRALVIAANKWDLVDDRRSRMAVLGDRLARSLPQIKGVPHVTLSAHTGDGLDRLMSAVFKAHDTWNRRIPTARLNRWLEDLVAAHPPPAIRGRPLRLRYITQTKARPPSFVLFVSRPAALPASYLRYVENGLRERFALSGTPIRIALRGGKNPYVSGKEG